MRLCVIPNRVPARDGFPDQLRAFAHKTPNQEKCGFGIVAVQKLQELWRNRGIGPVIKRDGQFARRIRTANGCAKELRARIHGAVSCESGGCSERAWHGDDPRIHGAILACKEARAAIVGARYIVPLQREDG